MRSKENERVIDKMDSRLNYICEQQWLRGTSYLGRLNSFHLTALDKTGSLYAAIYKRQLGLQEAGYCNR